VGPFLLRYNYAISVEDKLSNPGLPAITLLRPRYHLQSIASSDPFSRRFSLDQFGDTRAVVAAARGLNTQRDRLPIQSTNRNQIKYPEQVFALAGLGDPLLANIRAQSVITK
jgi:hypothetical protein